MGADGQKGLPKLLHHGIGTTIRNNYSAYGFSVMITASFAVVATIQSGATRVGDIMLFALGAVGAFTVIEAIVSGGFKHQVRGDPTDVVALGTALSFISVGLAIATAAGTAELLGAWIAWLGAPFAATAVYVLASGFEMAVAERLKGRG